MKNWYIAITEENESELLEWWNDNVSNGCRPPCVGEYLMSKNPKDNSCFWSKIDTDHHGLNWQQEYELITLEQFRQITNSNKMKHPEKWYIVATKENHTELNAWRKTVSGTTYNNFSIDHPLLSNHPGDNSYYYGGSVDSLRSNSDYNDYQEITLEQFRQITNSKPMSETTAIQISRNLLNEYYEASTNVQKEYLSEHFKLNGWTTVRAIRGLYDIACEGWKPKIKANHPDCFEPESKEFDFGKYYKNNDPNILKDDIGNTLGLSNNFIQIRCSEDSNYCYKGFYLDMKYNWELVTDNRGEIVLVPTKK
jgi:hypothetical protein